MNFEFNESTDLIINNDILIRFENLDNENIVMERIYISDFEGFDSIVSLKNSWSDRDLLVKLNMYLPFYALDNALKFIRKIAS